MSVNVMRSPKQSNLGLTQVESTEDVYLALYEMEGEFDQFLIELGEMEKLQNEQVNVFTESWRERLSIMRNRAQACQQVMRAPKPSLSLVKP